MNKKNTNYVTRKKRVEAYCWSISDRTLLHTNSPPPEWPPWLSDLCRKGKKTFPRISIFTNEFFTLCTILELNSSYEIINEEDYILNDPDFGISILKKDNFEKKYEIDEDE